MTKGGFDSFKKAQSAQETRLRLKEMEAPERKQSSAVSGSKKKRRVGEAAAGEPPSNGGGGPPPRWPKMTMKEIFEHLLVTMTPDELTEFLPDASAEGDRATIILMRDRDTTNGMAVWRALDFEFDRKSL